MTTSSYKDTIPVVDDYLSDLREEVKKVILSQHLKALRVYAQRIMVLEETLSDEDETDRQVRMRETLIIAGSLGISTGETVFKIFGDVF